MSINIDKAQSGMTSLKPRDSLSAVVQHLYRLCLIPTEEFSFFTLERLALTNHVAFDFLNFTRFITKIEGGSNYFGIRSRDLATKLKRFQGKIIKVTNCMSV